VGAPGNDTNGGSAGKITIYNINELLSTSSFDIKTIKVFPNPTSGLLEVSLPRGLELKQINIYNPLGQLIQSSYTTKMDLSMLSSGSYLTEVITDKVKLTKTIIVN
ncbi:MAG: T9SS type A sorting domain-containing protein, partial [Bacteroidia bacterium]|nr:T9SS type A sorting domain-containing protein [Bacteroidia bacterium]